MRSLSLRSIGNMGAVASVYGVSKFGSSLTVFDFTTMGSSLALRCFTRVGSGLSVPLAFSHGILHSARFEPELQKLTGLFSLASLEKSMAVRSAEKSKDDLAK